MRMDQRWVLRFMEIARQVAVWSKDPSRKVGALLVSHDGRQVSWGYNGLPRGIDSHEGFGCEKNDLTVHAEANALMNCPFPTEGLVMFTTFFPCHECAKLIRQAGVTDLVTYHPSPGSSWAGSQELAEQILRGSTHIVLLDLHDGAIDAP